MKTSEDIKINEYYCEGQVKTYKSICIDDNDFIDAPLWYHKRGLMQTATGYGKKLNSGKKFHFNNRWYRVYTHIFSNSGTNYIIVKGEHIIIK